MRKYVLMIMVVLFPIFCFTKTRDILEKDSINCKELDRTEDEFTNEVKIQFSVPSKDGGNVDLIKYINNKSTDYYLSIWIKESGIYTGTGVSIILKNGKKINKPKEEVDYSYAGDNFFTTAFIRLNKSDIALLKDSGIAKYKLYISTGDITEKSDLCKTLFNCLLNAN